MSLLFILFALVVFLFCITVIVFFFFNMLSIILSGAFFAPSGKVLTNRMVALAAIRPGEKALDLGSGDGSQVIALAKAGAKAYGYEINPLLVWWSQLRIYHAGLKDKAFVYTRNFWKTNVSEFDVIIIFGIPYMMKRMEKKLMQELKPGSRVISNAFPFPNWQYSKRDGKIYLYEVK